MCWIPGDAGIEANEVTDRAAKEAVKECLDWTDSDENSAKSIKEMKSLLQKSSTLVWQRQWNIQDTG